MKNKPLEVEKGEKEYKYRGTFQVMMVRKESLMCHEGLIRKERVIKEIQGRKE